MATSTGLILNAPQQHELVAISQSRSLPAGYVFRAKLILMLAEGASFRTIKHKLGLCARLLSPVYHGESGLRTLRELARSYMTLTQDVTRVINRIKAIAFTFPVVDTLGLEHP